MIELPIRVAVPDVTHVDALETGTRLGEFEILGLIGVGGFGMVYRAYDHSLQRDVAIKEYMPTALASRSGKVLNITVRTSGDQETFQTGLASFVDEARMLARFEHPSLVKVFRFWEANGTAYMVMPLYRGMTLKQARLRMRTPPTEAWLRKVLWSILGALKVLHRGKALHRDISPDNIFLQDIGPPVLLDLGAARLALGDNPKQHTAILKVNFAPIEQYADVREMPQGPWTDLYALAAVVHGMLCNEAPMPATMRAVNDSMPGFTNVVKTLATEFGQSYSDAFVTGIAWALHIRPQDRPQSVQEFARALGLSTPSGMSSFDWRAELRPACLPEGDVLQVSGTPGTGERTRPDPPTLDYLPTQRVKSPPEQMDTGKDLNPTDTIPAPPEPAKKSAQQDAAEVSRRTSPARSAPTQPAGPPAHRRTYGRWVVASSLLGLTLVLASWGWHKASINTETKAGSSASTTAIATPAVSPPAAEAATAPAAVDANAPVTPPVTSSVAPSVAPAKPAKPVAPRRNTTPLTTRIEAPSPATVIETPPMQAKPEPAPHKPAAKPAQPAMTPEMLCVDSNFLTRPMCLYRACQRAELTGTTACIELEQRLKRNAEVNKQ